MAKLTKSGKPRKKPPTAHLKATQFKKGQSGNPNGAKAHNPLLRASRELSMTKLTESIKLIMSAPLQELKDMLLDPELSVAQRIVLKAAIQAEHTGSFHQLNTIIERVVGKVPDQVQISSPDGSMSPKSSIDINKLSLEDLKKLKELQQKSDGH